MQQWMLTLLGPMAARELTIASNRKSSFVLRTAFAAILGISALVVLGRCDQMEIKQISVVGHSLFQFTFVIQMAAVLTAVPAIFAGMIAGERQDGSLDLLLATDLLSREIVLGKWIGGLVPSLLLLLGAVPVIAMALLLGGIDPQSVVISQLLVFVMLLMLSAFSLAVSSHGRSSGSSLAATLFFIAIATIGVPYALVGVGELLGFGSTIPTLYRGTILHLMEVAQNGNYRQTTPNALFDLLAGLLVAVIIAVVSLRWANACLRQPSLRKSRIFDFAGLKVIVWVLFPVKWVWSQFCQYQNRLRENPLFLRKTNSGYGRIYWQWLVALGWVCATTWPLLLDDTSIIVFVLLFALLSVQITITFTATSRVVLEKRNGILGQLLTTDIQGHEYVDATYFTAIRSTKFAYLLGALFWAVFFFLDDRSEAPLIAFVHLLWLLHIPLFAVASSITTRSLPLALVATALFVFWGLWPPLLLELLNIGPLANLNVPQVPIVYLALGLSICPLVTYIWQRLFPGVLSVSAFAFTLYSCAGAVPALLLGGSHGVLAHQWHFVTLNHPGPLSGYLVTMFSFVCSFLALRFWLIRNFDRLAGRATLTRKQLSHYKPGMGLPFSLSRASKEVPIAEPFGGGLVGDLGNVQDRTQ